MLTICLWVVNFLTSFVNIRFIERHNSKSKGKKIAGKSERNILRTAQKIEEIQTHVKKLKAEQELLKYSPANKCGYLHNLSVTIGLIKQFEVFHQELKQKDKLRKKYNRPSDMLKVKTKS